MNSFILETALAAGTSLILTYALIAILARYGSLLGLMDRPNARKVHKKAIPLVGGIGIVFGSTIAIFMNPLATETILELAIPAVATCGIFFMAVWDDRKNVPARFRLLIQLLAAIAVTSSGLRIESMHGLFGIQDISPLVQHALTIVVIVGVANAFNLVDGIDGLAGGLALINMIVLASVAYVMDQSGLAIICVVIGGALAAFLKYNAHPARVFMGDGGSMTLGFFMAVVGIKLLQSSGGALAISDTLFVLIACTLLLPVVDALRVFIQRYSQGVSIFNPDRTHLHHLVLHMGWNTRHATNAVLGLNVLLILSGLILVQFSGITTVITTLALLQLTLSRLLKLHKNVREWQLRLHHTENNALRTQP